MPPLLLRIGRIIRDAWLILGATLAVLLAVEAAYRGLRSVRQAIRASRAPEEAPHPDAGQPWYAELRAVRSTAPDKLEWRPYVEWGSAPFHGTYWNTDSLGHRRTVQAHTPATTLRRVFVFGGSNLHGTMMRDSMTIPSRLAAELASRGIRDVVITNYGDTGYTFTQEALELLLELRAGARPAVVAFLDGGNEVGSAMQNGRAGIPLNEGDRSRDFEAGRKLFTWRSDAAAEWGVMRELGRIASRRLQLLDRFFPSPGEFESIPYDSVADDIVRMYLGTVEWVEALARHYGFVAFYAWEPLLGSITKPLSPSELRLTQALSEQALGRRLLDVRRLVPGRLAPGAEAAVPGRFADFSVVFAGDSATVFWDDAHTTESGSAVIAAELGRRLAPYLTR